MMRVLGAILAGGKARRFGSDKAQALYEGDRLIDLVSEALAAQCDTVIVCGRDEPGFTCIPDRPEPDLGPLGGLYAALHHAEANGFSHVLSAPCDVPNLPKVLVKTLASDKGCARFDESQPVIGLWPVNLASELTAFLASGKRSLYGFVEHVGAQRYAVNPPLKNVNRPEDLTQN